MARYADKENGALDNGRHRLPQWTCVLAAAAMAAVVFIIDGFTTVTNYVNDDYGIALALSGYYPNSGLCLFVNAAISQLTLAISTAFPGINAFYTVEEIVTALALAVLTYSALMLMNSKVIAVGVIGAVSFLLVPMCTYLNNFTCVASFTTLAGFLVLTLQLFRETTSTSLTVIAIALCLVGFMLRVESFLLALPFVAIAVVAKLVSCVGKGEHSISLGRLSRCIVPFFILAAVCFFAAAYDAIAWSSPEWNEWRQFNESRAQVNDYPMPEYGDVEEELAEAGISELDYWFARSWRYADQEFFTSEIMAHIAALSGSSNALGPRQTLGFIRYLATTYWQTSLIVMVLLAVFVAVIRRMNTHAKATVALLLLLMLTLIAYFAHVGRLPERVLYSIVAYGVVFSSIIISERVYSGDGERVARINGTRHIIALTSSIALCAVAFLAVLHGAHLNFDAPRNIAGNGFGDNQAASLSAYIRENENSLFVVDVSVDNDYVCEHQSRYLPSGDELMRVFTLGGWTTGSPYMKAKNQSSDMENVMKGLVENSRARQIVQEGQRGTIDEMVAYLEGHYYRKVHVELVDTIATSSGQRYLVYRYFEATE